MSTALPALDTTALAAEANAKVAKALQRAGGDPVKVIKAATRLIDANKDKLADARFERAKVAVSIREYGPDATEPVPVNMRNVRLAEATGISRPRLQVLRNAYGQREVPLVPNARKVLPKIARTAKLYELIEEAALQARDQAIIDLIRDGWTNKEIAEHMRRDVSRVAHLRYEVKVADLMDQGLGDDAILAELGVDLTDPEALASARRRLSPLRRRHRPALARTS